MSAYFYSEIDIKIGDIVGGMIIKADKNNLFIPKNTVICNSIIRKLLISKGFKLVKCQSENTIMVEIEKNHFHRMHIEGGL